MTQKRHVVIVGGGIIGCTTAYFLTRHPAFNPAVHTITLIEATSIAAGASGKAGGLLALWAYPKCLAKLSFRLHASLAREHSGPTRWGYRELNCGQLEAQAYGPINRSLPAGALHKRTPSASARARKAASTLPKDLDWISPTVNPAYEAMASAGDTAQVHPRLFTESMASLAQAKGLTIISGQVQTIEHSASSTAKTPEVNGVTYSTPSSSTPQTLRADTVIIAAGPWTPTIYPPAPITAMRAHSIVIRPPEPVSPYALFTELSTSKTSTASPEIYARPDDTVYACGEGDTDVSLPSNAGAVEVDEARCDVIIEQVGRISEELGDGEVVARQACYLPQIRGEPLIGETGVKGLVLAAGHTCWGIQNAPATGACVAELIWEGEVKSADLRELDPRKFAPKAGGRDW